MCWRVWLIRPAIRSGRCCGGRRCVSYWRALAASSRTWSGSIADEFGLSLKTVDWHVARGCSKLERAAALHERMQRETPAADIDRQRRES